MTDTRRKSAQHPAASSSVHPIGTPNHGISPNTGPLATAVWVAARGLTLHEPRWFAEIELVDGNTLLKVELFSEEWGFVFRREDRESWIRITDVPFVHGRDDHELLAVTPPLKGLGTLVGDLERRYAVRFDPKAAVIRTSLADGEPAIRAWIRSW